MVLPDGYSDVPAGKVAAVVTCLDMSKKPALRDERADAPWQLRRVERPDVSWYRGLYSRVGADWLWFSRLAMSRGELESILLSHDVEVYALSAGGCDEGFLELDFRAPGICELAFFGLTATVQGQGAGRWLMNRVLARAWDRAITRLWVHTCTLDHPGALEFYIRSGFRPYSRRIEVFDDPRLSGLVPHHAAPHIPVL